MKNQKGFIQIPLLIAIIAGVLVLGSVGYFGVKQYQNFQQQNIEREKEAQTQADTQKLALEQAQSEIQKLQSEVSTTTKKQASITQQTTGASKPQQQNSAIDQSSIVYKYITADTSIWSSTSETPIGNITKGTKVILVSKASGFSTVKFNGQNVLVLTDYLTDSMSPNTDASAIFETWKPFSVYILCDFKSSDGTTYLQKSGSGTDYDGTVITNRHVITDDNGYGASSCSLKFTGSDHVFVEPISSIGLAKNGDDWGVITVADKKLYIQNTPPQGMYGCYGPAPSAGDEVLILGYPAIGSQTSVTATRGIISGKDGSYYITDAKIDHGNSGGTAILIKDNCYLGIPTYAITGTIESLGRILDIKTVPIVGRG